MAARFCRSFMMASASAHAEDFSGSQSAYSALFLLGAIAVASIFIIFSGSLLVLVLLAVLAVLLTSPAQTRQRA